MLQLQSPQCCGLYSRIWIFLFLVSCQLLADTLLTFYLLLSICHEPTFDQKGKHFLLQIRLMQQKWSKHALRNRLKRLVCLV